MLELGKMARVGSHTLSGVHRECLEVFMWSRELERNVSIYG